MRECGRTAPRRGMDKPAKNEFCPTCQQPMKWFGDHWKCVNIKVHDQAANAKRGGR